MRWPWTPVYQAECGETVEEMAIALALFTNHTGRQIVGRLNNILVIARPGETAKTVLDHWRIAAKQQSRRRS